MEQSITSNSSTNRLLSNKRKKSTKKKRKDRELPKQHPLFQEQNAKNNHQKQQNLPHNLRWSAPKRWISIFSGLIEHILFCGLMCGWSSIQYVYQQSCYCLPEDLLVYENHAYNFTCGNNYLKFPEVDDPILIDELTKKVRNQQQLSLAIVMRVAFQCFIITGFFWGLLFDKIGTRYFRILMMVLLSLGCGLASLADQDKFFLLYLAMPLIQISGISLLGFEGVNFAGVRFQQNIYENCYVGTSSAQAF